MAGQKGAETFVPIGHAASAVLAKIAAARAANDAAPAAAGTTKSNETDQPASPVRGAMARVARS